MTSRSYPIRADGNPLAAYVMAARCGWREFRVIYRWRTYIFGWLIRVVAQIAFIASIGLLVDSREIVDRLALGSACASAALAAVFVIPMTAAERYLGTAPLLVISPAGLTPAIFGRAAERVIDGIVSGTVAITAVVAVIYHEPLGWPGYLLTPIVAAVTTLSSCGLALVIAVIVLFAPQVRNLLSNIVFMLLLLISGAAIPFRLGGVFGDLAAVLPIDHALAAERALLRSNIPATWQELGLECLVAVGWLAIAVTAARLAGRLSTRFGGLD